MKTHATFKLSQVYYSMQTEGFTMGKPAIVLMLGGCNLDCTPVHGGDWQCDVRQLWKRPKKAVVQKVYEHILKIAPKNTENISLVITGGEPLRQQYPIRVLLNKLQGKFYVELETNGTIKPDLVADQIDQFNVSPKLPSSGNNYNIYYKERVIDYLIDECNSHFKFVIAKESDIEDVYNYYGRHLSRMGKSRIWLMPASTNQEEFQQKAGMVAELCRVHGFNFSSRLNINIWNNGGSHLYHKFTHQSGILAKV